MVKGVNRQVLEIRDPGSPYFERAFFFVKPEYAFTGEQTLRRAAEETLTGTDRLPRTRRRRIRKLHCACSAQRLRRQAARSSRRSCFCEHLRKENARRLRTFHQQKNAPQTGVRFYLDFRSVLFALFLAGQHQRNRRDGRNTEHGKYGRVTGSRIFIIRTVAGCFPPPSVR